MGKFRGIIGPAIFPKAPILPINWVIHEGCDAEGTGGTPVT